ncbi:hypothetical protein K435DRAFT_793878 [Dendrothele bispora CBS 962.96]|uniref:Uncharacterized protein n=1 Tax=Dendrothele bispora (strain CBS 962.96) TaxID=1314807 RepID=A0A4S8MEJ3_DENBC|nr:hypothetical protein K435DRAFT_793878 [Dendrothele bispora CBS 962.96]
MYFGIKNSQVLAKTCKNFVALLFLYTVDLISLLGPNATQGANKGGVNLVSSVKLLKTAELENVKCLLQSQLEESAIELEEKQDSDPSLSSAISPVTQATLVFLASEVALGSPRLPRLPG